MNYKRRKAVSQIIATLLLVAITVVAAVMVSGIFQRGLTNVNTNVITNTKIGDSIKITGYDTRDSNTLSSITNLNNFLSPSLCTTSCSGANADNIPTGGGTEFIVLKIKNVSTSPVTIKDILVNDIDHLPDIHVGGTLDASSSNNLLSGGYPHNGKFTIIPAPPNNSIVQISNQLSGGNEERLVIKLSKSITPDITQGTPIRIHFITGNLEQSIFAISSGGAR